MNMPNPKRYAGMTVCFMVIFPVVFLLVYPLIYVALPDSLAIFMDLLQDLSLILLIDILVVPAFGLWSYWRDRRRALLALRGIKEKQDTRDVY